MRTCTINGKRYKHFNHKRENADYRIYLESPHNLNFYCDAADLGKAVDAIRKLSAEQFNGTLVNFYAIQAGSSVRADISGAELRSKR